MFRCCITALFAIVLLGPTGERAAHAQDIVINEIHYNPLGEDSSVLLEYIELYNADATTVGLGAWELDFGPVPYVFPGNAQMAPGEYVVVAENAAALLSATGWATPYEWGGTNGLATGLGNGSDDIILRDGIAGGSNVIDMVVYDDDPPWPTAPDGDGPSLELVNPTLDNAQYTAWRASLGLHGTPGAINSVYSDAPVVVVTTPTHRSAVASLDAVVVTFSAPVTGVAAGDLTVNGSPATGVMPASGPSETYTFTGFAAPPAGSTSFALAAGSIEAGGIPFAGHDWTASVGITVVINEIHYHPPDPNNEAEFFEIYNAGSNGVDLSNWTVSDGLDMQFAPGVSLPAGGYLVVALDPNLVETLTGYAGALAWQGGRLANEGERLALSDAGGNQLDVVDFGDGGAWDPAADGDGPSLELVNPLLPNGYGAAWTASGPEHGTPGAVNSGFEAAPAPLIVGVRHAPAIPAAFEPVAISALVLDDDPDPLVTLYYRQDADPTVAYSATVMNDAGTNGDIAAGDGVYTATVAGLADGERLDFTIRADDGAAVAAAPPGHDDLTSNGYPAQTFLCKFSDAPLYTDFPQYHLITTQRTRNQQSTRNKVEYDATFIRCPAGGDCEIHYNIIERYRGASSLNQDPPSFRFEFPASAPLESEMGFDITGVNLMGQQPARQALGYRLFEDAGHSAPRNQFVRLNTNPLADGAVQDFLYINVERIDDDFIASQNGQVVPLRFPDRCSGSDAVCDNDADCPMGESCLPTAGGNVYRGRHDDAEFRWEGFDPAAYMVNIFERNGYQVITNEDNHDWTDLINLCDAMNCSTTDGGLLCVENTYDNWYPQHLGDYAEINQWLEWFALHMALNNVEGGIYRDTGDDYFIYFRPTGDHAEFLPWDMDAILPNVQETIWRTNPDRVPAVARVLRHNAFAGRFVKAICDLLDNEFSQAAMEARIDALPDAAFPTATPQGNGPTTKAGMKSWVTARRNFIHNEIIDAVTLEGAPASPYTGPDPLLALGGQLDQCGTQTVWINGQPVDDYSVYAGSWSDDWALTRGANPIIVQCRDHLGQEVDRVETTIAYQPPPASIRLTVPARMVNDKTLTLQAEVLDAGGAIDWRTCNQLGTVSAERVADGSPVDTSITVFETFNAGAGAGTPPADSIRLYNGVGSVSLTLDNGAAEPAGEIQVTVNVGGVSASKIVTVLDADSSGLFTPLSGALSGADLTWGPDDGVIHLTGDVTVGNGDILTILPGTLVMVDAGPPNDGVAIVVNGGAVSALGTQLEPIFFFPANGPAAMALPQTQQNNDAAWRGFYHYGAGTSDYAYVFVTGAGNAIVSSHPRPPIFHVTDSYSLNLDNCVLADCPGMGVSAIGGASGTYNIRTSLFSRMGIGGEWLGSGYALNIEDTWFSRIGRAPEPNDVDGDILHVDRPGNTINVRRSVLTDCGDDIIDHSTNATPVVEDCIMYDARDKAVSLDGSSGAAVTLINCLVFDTPSGIRCDGSTVHLVNSTISAPISNPSSASTMESSIIWPNAYNSCTGTVGHSLLGPTSNLSCGVGNFTADPGWVDPGGCNYALSPLSPAATAGPGGERIGWLGFPTGSACLNDDECDDDYNCTIDACNVGACVNVPLPGCIPCTQHVDCDDGNPCTDEICHPLLGCQYTDNKEACDDGVVCTAFDACSNGVCIGEDTCLGGSACNPLAQRCELAETFVFQEGLAGYAGAEDTFLEASAPGADNGAAELLEWDTDDPPGSGLASHLLVRFTELFAGESGPIPADATVTAASLAYTVEGPDAPLGHDGTLHEVIVPWDASTTFATFGGDAGVQPDEYDPAVVAIAPGGLDAGAAPVTVEVDVTTSVQAWSAFPGDNLGWIVAPTGTNGVQVAASEYAADPALRPRLTIHTVTICEDNNACTDDAFGTNGCEYTANYDAQTECCNPATGATAIIDDGNACTDDACNTNGAVTHTPNYDPLIDCCAPADGALSSLDDFNACTDDACDSNGHAVHTPNYDDGVYCCDPITSQLEAFDDGDPCTDDLCDSNGVVIHEALPDCDSDGVCDLIDNCPTVANAGQENTDLDAYGDACDGPFDDDHDGDVDADDLATMVADCQTAPGESASGACQETFDWNGDLSVDLLDFAAFQKAFTGAAPGPCD